MQKKILRDVADDYAVKNVYFNEKKILIRFSFPFLLIFPSTSRFRCKTFRGSPLFRFFDVASHFQTKKKKKKVLAAFLN